MTIYDYGLMIGIGGLLIFWLNPFFKVEQGYVYIIERHGKFLRLARAGLGVRSPLADKLKGPINLRIIPLETLVEGMTLDEVFVNMKISIQYRVLPDKIYEAFYTFTNPEAHIKSLLADIAWVQMPKLNIRDIFDQKEDLAASLGRALGEYTLKFGFEVVQTLITDMQLDSHVKAAINAITEAKRLKIAAQERGEAERLFKHKQLEIEVETKLLEGKGLAGQWGMLLGQLQQSLEALQKSLPNVDPKDILKLLTHIHTLEIKKEIALIKHTVEMENKEPPAETREAVIHTAAGFTKQMLEKLIPAGGSKEEKKG